MAAIIRVKRKQDEDPAESLIIQYKRSKLDGNETDEPGKLCLNLVTTVKSKDAVLSRPLQKTLRRHQLQTDYKSHGSKRISQSEARAENSARSKANRYRIVNSRRALTANSSDSGEAGFEASVQRADEKTESLEQTSCKVDKVPSSDSSAETSSSSENAGASSEVDDPIIHDIEVDTSETDSVQHGVQVAAPSSGSGITLNGQLLVSRPMLAVPESSYVYDLYYINSRSREHDFRDIENILSIEALHDTLAADTDRMEECEEVYDDEDDSNDESNWRNDYPDEDPDKVYDNSDLEFDDDFLEGEESQSYRHTLNDDILAEAIGSRLHIFGSDTDGEGSDEEDAYQDDKDDIRGLHHMHSTYECYMHRVKREMNSEQSDSENSD